MKRAIVLVTSKERWPQTKLAADSAALHNPGADVLITCPEPLGSGYYEQRPLSNPEWIVTERPRAVRLALQAGYSQVMFLDGDTYTYKHPGLIWHRLDYYSLVVTPHVTRPLPDDGMEPSLRQIALMGNYNSGVFGVTPRALPFIEWWEEQTKAHPALRPHEGYAAEQGWLRYAPDFNPSTCVLREEGYNTAYWNIWYQSLEAIRIAHFSGAFVGMDPGQMSRHQNRWHSEPGTPIYNFYEAYLKKLKEAYAHGGV